ncbi:MAG: helix-turn-helix transcriptional regulator [Chitinispirillales bacterium]|nr:helix-turn-helix transcriptional regulator [Chitinispirillales bacterium]
MREIRQANGLSQVKFSERIAISGSYTADMELGKRKVNERIIRLISNEFNVNEHWFRTGEGEMYNDKEEIAVAEVVSIFKSLPPSHQTVALSQLNALAMLNTSP